jgi:hypothetical protein
MPRTRPFMIPFSLLIIALALAACTPGGASPQAGATYAGELTIQQIGATGRALGGTIRITLSEDGTGIAELAYTLEGDVCKNQGLTVTGTGATLRQDPPPPVEEGRFAWLSDGVRAEGTFVARDQAEGTITLAMEKQVQSRGETVTLACDYGTWAWTAEVE